MKVLPLKNALRVPPLLHMDHPQYPNSCSGYNWNTLRSWVLLSTFSNGLSSWLVRADCWAAAVHSERYESFIYDPFPLPSHFRPTSFLRIGLLTVTSKDLGLDTTSWWISFMYFLETHSLLCWILVLIVARRESMAAECELSIRAAYRRHWRCMVAATDWVIDWLSDTRRSVKDSICRCYMA